MSREKTQFAAMFGEVRRERGILAAEANARHILGKCTVALGHDKNGWFIEACQNMGWTDFDSVKKGLLADSEKFGVTLVPPGPDGISQPVLRVRMPVAGTVKRTWEKVTGALAAMDEVLRREG
jgi:hypothetical protein